MPPNALLPVSASRDSQSRTSPTRSPGFSAMDRSVAIVLRQEQPSEQFIEPLSPWAGGRLPPGARDACSRRAHDGSPPERAPERLPKRWSSNGRISMCPGSPARSPSRVAGRSRKPPQGSCCGGGRRYSLLAAGAKPWQAVRLAREAVAPDTPGWSALAWSSVLSPEGRPSIVRLPIPAGHPGTEAYGADPADTRARSRRTERTHVYSKGRSRRTS
jgi:hypothetical protein